MPDRSSPPSTIYLSGHGSKERKGRRIRRGRRCGDHVALPSPQEGLLCLGSWPRQTASPIHPPQTQAALFRLTAFTLQAASFCVCLHAWVKRLRLYLRDSTFKSHSYFSGGKVYKELEGATTNKKTYPSFCPSLSVTTL